MKIRNVLSTSYISNNFVKNRKINKLPIVTTPLVAYYVGEYQDNNVEDILTFLNNKNITIPSNLKPHSLTKTGWDLASQSKVKNTLENAFKENKITEQEYKTYKNKVTFTGDSDNSCTSDTTTDTNISDDIITDGVQDFVSTALPVYNAARAIQKVCEGDEKEIVKQSVGVIDNIVCQPVKQTVAGAVAAKGALIGSIFGPVGAGIGAIAGYVGTLWGWGKARNSIVDSMMDD